MQDIYNIMNSIDDDRSLDKTIKTHKFMNESYIVKYGHGSKSDSFDSLEDAVAHINDGIKNHSSNSFVLYNDRDELIWIDEYADRSGSDLGYSVSRSNDKKLNFDKSKGLTITEGRVNRRHVKDDTNKSVRRLVEDEQDAPEQGADNASNTQDSIIDKFRKIGNYETFVNALKSLNDNQKKLFAKEFGTVDAIKPSTTKTGIDVTKLVPTQSEIDWKKSLSYGLKQDCSYFFKSPVELGMPVLTYNSKYIIDGHHRWSQVFMFNPEGQVSCIDFKYEQGSAEDVLKDFQSAILATTGDVPVGTAGTNIWNVSEDELRKFIETNISDACWNSLVKAGVAEDKNSAVQYIVNNALTLQKKIRPAAGAPDRVDMPQTTPEVIKKASNAISDMSEEYDDDIEDLKERYYDDEAPYGRDRQYDNQRGVGVWKNEKPSWYKGSNADWQRSKELDRETNKPYRP